MYPFARNDKNVHKLVHWTLGFIRVRFSFDYLINCVQTFIFSFISVLLLFVYSSGLNKFISFFVLYFLFLCIFRLIKNETGRAILRVISGPRAFKVVLFTRLTPIPFGVQNAIFGVSYGNFFFFWFSFPILCLVFVDYKQSK